MQLNTISTSVEETGFSKGMSYLSKTRVNKCNESFLFPPIPCYFSFSWELAHANVQFPLFNQTRHEMDQKNKMKIIATFFTFTHHISHFLYLSFLFPFYLSLLYSSHTLYDNHHPKIIDLTRSKCIRRSTSFSSYFISAIVFLVSLTNRNIPNFQ